MTNAREFLIDNISVRCSYGIGKHIKKNDND